MKFKKLVDNAFTPKYATVGAAAFDLSTTDAHCLKPGEFFNYKTGLAFEVPKNHVLLVFSRSGMGFKSNVRLCNCVGVIDSDYRGEVCVGLQNDSADKIFDVKPGDRIAQGIVIPCEQIELEQVENLSSTARGIGGFGSTGK